MSKVFKAKHAQGDVVEGVCLTANDGFSARYDLDRINGVFSRPTHKLFGEAYNNKILVLDTAKGGVASAWMIYEIKNGGFVLLPSFLIPSIQSWPKELLMVASPC